MEDILSYESWKDLGAGLWDAKFAAHTAHEYFRMLYVVHTPAQIDTILNGLTPIDRSLRGSARRAYGD